MAPIVVLLVVAQLVLPGIAAQRLRDRLPRSGWRTGDGLKSAYESNPQPARGSRTAKRGRGDPQLASALADNGSRVATAGGQPALRRFDYQRYRLGIITPEKGGTMATEETERYRQAAEDALGQLEWCIGYLHGIRKTAISAQLAKNRTYIRRQLMRKAEEPLPTQTTGET